MKVYGKNVLRNLFVRCLFSYSNTFVRESRLITLFIRYCRIRSLPSRIRRGLRQFFARLGRSRDSERKLKRFQSSMEKIFSINSRGSRGPESSGFISDEEDLDDNTPPDYSNSQLRIKLTSVKPGALLTETDQPVEIEMVVLK